MLLQEEGRLLISDPVGRYIPEFLETTVAVPEDRGWRPQGYEVVAADRSITIRDLLTHTSGIGYGYGVASDRWQEAYHYHFVPERLGEISLVDGHSGLVGYIRDGFGIYGYEGVGGVELSNADLDECHGHAHAPIGYHYHATIEYPYTIGCYRGSPL